MAVLDRLDALAPIKEKILAGERLDFDDGVTLMESDDLLPRGSPADAEGRRPRLDAGRRGRDLLRPRARPDRAGEGAPGGVVPRPRRRAQDGHHDAVHDALRARRDVRGARRPHAPPARA